MLAVGHEVRLRKQADGPNGTEAAKVSPPQLLLKM